MIADLTNVIAAWVVIVGGIIGGVAAAISGWTTLAEHRRKVRNERTLAELHAEAAAVEAGRPSLQTYSEAEAMAELRKIRKEAKSGDYLEHGAQPVRHQRRMPWAWLLFAVWVAALIVLVVGR